MKRNVFSELTEGFDALKAEREGKATLRTHAVKRKPAAVVTSSARPPSDKTSSGNLFRLPVGSKLP